MRQTLSIVLDFLSGRQQKVFALHEEDTDSKWSDITCGAPQGTKLAGITFLAVINYILSEHKDRYKFVDDLSLVLTYLLEGNTPIAQFASDIFDQLNSQCNESNLIINATKSKILRLCPLKRDFTPPLEVPFPVVSEVKILGVIFSRDCSFTAHVDSVIRKANASLQTLSKMRRLWLRCQKSPPCISLLCATSLGVCLPCVGPFSTTHCSPDLYDLESVQKRAVRIILGSRDIPYQEALITLSIQCLEQRLRDLIMRFGKVLLLEPSPSRHLTYRLKPDSRTRQKSKLIPIRAQDKPIL